MAGLTLHPIRVALAAQIVAHVTRATTGHPQEPGDHTSPAFVIRPGDPYVSYLGTFGPNGTANILLEVDIEVSTTQEASAAIAMDDYLSAGTGNTSSVFDAINFDKTLGGLVADCLAISADPPVTRDSDGVLIGTIHVAIIANKQNAKV